jgi:two-component system, NtrC family, sensor kinase
MIGRALLARGHEVVAVETAEAGLRMHAETPFPLVLVDWMLPGEVDGLSMVRTLRADPVNDDVVIVAVTGRNSMEDLDLLLSAGATDFLAKPFEIPVLDTRIAVAERTVQERQLRRTIQSELESLLDHMPDAVVSTNHDRKVVRLNRSFEQLLGYSEDELRGQDIGVIYPDNKTYREQVEARNGDLEDGTPRTHAMRMRSKDGRLVHVEVVRAPMDNGVVGVIRDVTERNELRTRLLLADRLASMGVLAAGVAHEINNPLTFIMGNLAYLAGELEGATDEPSREMLQVVDEAQQGAERVCRIVRELRVFARGDDDSIGPMDVRETLDQAIVMAQNEIRHKARLVKSYEDIPLIHANAGKLGQVFLNLLVNAAHALPSGSAAYNEIRVRCFLADNNVLVEVEDTGPGISHELIERIFEPFFTTKPIGEGTGLGLAICHGIVTGLGGTIEVDSEPGVGSTFRVTMPIGKRSA